MNFIDENSTYELFGNYEEEANDILYLKELYPKSMMTVQKIVDEECDKLEYDGSIMFDEYPDKENVLKLQKEIFDMVKKEEVNNVPMSQYGPGMPGDKWLMDIIGVLLINEMMRRRMRRRCGRYRGFC